MKKKLFCLVAILMSSLAFSRPTGTIKRLEGVQEQHTHKPIIYFKVIFSEPVIGFSEKVVEVYSTNGTETRRSDAVVSVIPTANQYEDQNFIVAVSGLINEGYYLSIPENSVLSIDDLSTNTPIEMADNDHIVYFSHLEEFFYINSDHPKSFFTKEQEIVNMVAYPISEFGFKRFNSITSSYLARGKLFKFTNYDIESRLVTFDIDCNTPSYHIGFEVYKDAIPDNSIESFNNWLCGGSDQIFYVDMFGLKHLYSYTQILPGQSIYLLCHSDKNNFGVYIEGLPLSSFDNTITDLDDKNQENILFGPNPVNTTLKVVSKTMEKAILFDNSGKIILTSTKPDLDVSQLERGIYYLQIIENGHSIRQKFIKE